MAADTHDLNPQQQAAVAHDGSVLVLSGAGTGKTRVITARIMKLLDDGAAPSSIMAVTFTNKAAREMRERISWINARSMFLGTFHSYSLRTLQRYNEQAGLPNNFQIIDTVDQEAIARRILVEEMGLPKQRDGGPRPYDYCGYVNKFKDHGLRAADVGRKEADKSICDFYAIYEEKIDREGKVDFPEMLLRTCELLEGNAEVRREVTDRFRYVLIDELQDVSGLQLRLLRSIKTRGTEFFGVGDDDQSIYRFRGGDPRLLQTFAHEFVGNKVLRLEKNYRSTDSILDLANWVISKNKGRLGKMLHGVAGKGKLPELVRYLYDEDEARSVAREVSQMVDEGVLPEAIAVLYRNNALSYLIEVELAKQNVPFKVHGGVRFFSRTEIKDALAYMRVAADKTDTESIRRSINTPPRGVGEKSWESLVNAASERGGLWEILRGSGQTGVNTYVSVIESITAAAEKGDLKEAARVAVEDSGLQKRHVSDGQPERAEHLDEIINAATRFQEESPEASLQEFLASVATEGEVNEARNMVTLMTIHSAKGLEFDHLFLIGVEEGILPSWSADTQEQVEEERRLLYVAITRTRKRLVMSLAKRRRVRGEMKFSNLSTLLRGLGYKGLVEFQGFTTPGEGNGTDDGDQEDYREASRVPRQLPEETVSVHGHVVGQKVQSDHFGQGIVLALSGSGDKAKAKVLFFKDRKQRWLALQLAGLRILGKPRGAS